MSTTQAPDYPNLPYTTITARLEEPGIAIVTLNRPDARNSFDNFMKIDLIDVYQKLDADDRVKVVIVTGADNKGKAFCAGADLTQGDFSTTGPGARWRTAVSEANKDHRDGGGQTVLAAYRIRKPTIAAINGHAVGVGITMTLPFDIRIAWKDAKVGFVFAKRGIIPEACSTFFLPRLIGHSRTLELLLRARVLPASHPSYGLLFSELVERREDVLDVAREMAREMCELNSAVSMSTIKAMVWHGYPTAEEQHILDSEAIATLGNLADGKEGVKSFMEKRAVKFTGTIPRDVAMRPWWNTTEIRGPNERADGKFKL